MTPQEQSKLAGLIKIGKVIIMPTDTIYGIVGLASNPEVVERIYQIKDREYTKPFVVLISDYSQLEFLGIDLTAEQKSYLETVWPGPVSVVVPTVSMSHLHRELNSLAIRMPNTAWLKEIIDKTGPIVATSANVSDQPYIHDLKNITDTLSDKVDYLSRTDSPKSNPSRIINIVDKSNLR